MNLHQVLTGAVNPGDNCFSLGSIGERPFTAYASGCDIVILGSDFERLQIIPGAIHGNIQVGCVDCSLQQGRIAASYGNVICIFEGVNSLKQKNIHSHGYNQWQKSSQFLLESIAHNLTWDPTGTRLLTGSSYLQLWSNANLEKGLEGENYEKTDFNLGDWRCIWQCRTSSSVHLMKFSPDGEFFATAAKDDCLVKVWYNTDSWQSAVTPPVLSPEKQTEGEVDFSFVYLAHPRAVNGFSWRKTSKYMPRGSICNVLLTCCKDNVCRLWAETLLPNDCCLSGGDYSQWTEPDGLRANFKRNVSSKERVQSALELNLRHFRRRRKSVALIAHTGYLPHQQDPHEVHRNMPLHANALCHFHIAASINPATDIPLLPSITSLSLDESEEKNGPFVVHWLNNKELHFTLSMEVFLQQFKKSVEQQFSETSTEDSNQIDGKSDEEVDDSGGGDQKGDLEKKEFSREKTVSNSSLSLIDHEIEILLAEWNKNADMLFSIHPLDGSLLVWHVDWLDEYQPGMFRQVQVSFVSRIPVAFPTGDANSLCKGVVMYACTKNVDLAIQQGKQKPSSLAHSTSMLISSGHSKPSNSLKLSIFTPNVLMISKHADGSLNQWLVSFAEESGFSTVLSISHKSRYCGHRFHLNDLACHSVLPLLLTTSHHNALRTPDVEGINGTCDKTPENSALRRPSRVTTTETSQDPNAVYSELILWRVDPVGPLSFSGGVSELARINSLHVSAFSNVAWLPTLIPSHCLGTYCNSPSACFVASDGQYLRLYQAVIDAKKLLCELSNPEISKYVGEVFNIVSQQSTARPGCIIELDAIMDLHGRKTQLLHVFHEDFIFGNHEEKQKKIPEKSSVVSDSSNFKIGFSEKFYLIVIEHTEKNHSVLHMWNLHLKSVPVSIDSKLDTNVCEAMSQKEVICGSPGEKFHPPLTHRFQTCRANLQSTSRLTLSSENVYSQELDLPEGIEIISVKPSAGHLSSSCIYPVCYAPYLLATLCSDGKVRFWRCRVVTESDVSSTCEQSGNITYLWEEWPLLEDGLQNASAVSVPGRPVEVSCAHTTRLAVAFKQATVNSNRSSQDFMMHVSIFECESTGGSSWILEQTIHLDDVTPVLDSGISIDNNLMVYNKHDACLSYNKHNMPSTKHLIHLDWMSREDGSHILTVGIGSKLLMYGQLAGKVPDQTCKEVFTLPVWESVKHLSHCRFVLLRCVDLVSSVEGSHPLPVSLSWVRDGILVVGMDCEMHVYSQWQPSPRRESIIADSQNGSTPSITNLMKQSLSVGSAMQTSKKTLTRSMTSLAQKLMGKKTAFDLPVEMEDFGLFEAAHALFPTLPQYHPLQLLELMDLGKVRRAKAILAHLVKCIAGEIVAVNDFEPNHERRLRSLSISASGSTARDPKTFNKTENTDYTEIDSVPPLPLYALLAADEDISYTTSEKPINCTKLAKGNDKNVNEENYDELFQIPTLSTEELNMLDVDEENTKPQVIDLSQYSPTYFGPEHSQVLSSHLLHSSLPGLTRMEQMSLMALADTIATTSTDIGESRDRNQGGETLDECGLKFFLAVRLHTFLATSLPPVQRAQLLHQGLSTIHFAWAFHSVAEEELLNMLPAMQKGDPTWSELRAMGVGWWVRNIHNLRKCIEKVAKAAFQRNNDPLDAAIFYLAMRKKAVVWGLYRSQREVKMTQFFGNNFNEDRWRKAALKNAFSLLGKQRFEHSAAFFLLAGSLKDAVEVCLEKLHDVQLALVVSRLYESEFEISATYKAILENKILGRKSTKDLNLSDAHEDPFVRSMVYWILEDYSRALDTLLEESVKEAGGEGIGISSACNPSVFNFYNFLRTHPLLLRRHFGSSNASSSKVCLTVENGLADKINLRERRLFFTTAYAHLKAGCPMLALEILSKMPKVVKKSEYLLKSSSVADSDDISLVSLVKTESKEERVSDCNSSTDINGMISSESSLDKHSNPVLSFDWSQPSMTFQDDPLALNWDSDNDEDPEQSGLLMKDVKPIQKTMVKNLGEISSNCTDNLSTIDENILSPSEDILAVQLKFRACLKILTVELRTLSTGYEVDGGKLRYQLYQWLEREVMALQKTCDYNVNTEELKSGISETIDQKTLRESEEKGTLDQKTSKQQVENVKKRRQWLLKFQSLLRIFLSYCILHGSHGGGLASVRMELILLLQESQQENSVGTLPNLQPEQTSVPLLFACTASAKTVVANPLLHLTNLTHDILDTIINLGSPPHPDIQNSKIHVMHTLAASLSACIYQCLCGGHSCNSPQTNQFTGMVYQSVLLAHRQPLRTMSLDETVTPNTLPYQWPGITSLIHIMNSAGEEAQPGLTILLCEILTAVYLSLFIHGLATHSSNELFRIVAHPLNDKMWSAVFGGGVCVQGKEQTQSKSTAGRHFSLPSPHQVVVFSMECVGFSKTLTAINTHSPTSPAASPSEDDRQKQFRISSEILSKETQQQSVSPVIEQEPSAFREKFIPPELSIWDYFIAKPFIQPSQNRVEYDSEESQGSDEEEEDSFVTDVQIQEHSNSSSYSWSLMRLAMVQIVLENLKTFYPFTGHDLSELPVGSPLCHAVLKTLQRWEQVLLHRLEIHDGPPENFISMPTTEEAISAGPAILRHKALLESTNMPFKSKHHSALPVKRLWHYLVKQEIVQETFIRNIFTRNRSLSEIETDVSYPGGKARIIHKESDIITAFAVNKANRNCIAIASSHDVQELDVSGILATQIYSWADDEMEVETKGTDDFLVIHTRDDLATGQGSTPYTHSNPGTPINMPWLGGTQTGRGASVMIKKLLNNVRRMASHPTLPYYLTGAQDGSVRMFEWGHSQQIACFRPGGNSRVTRIRFSHQGNKFGIVDGDGYIYLYQTNWKCSPAGSLSKPYLTWQCHNKTANDFVFISSSSLIATAGQSNDNRNICLWDTLVTPNNSLVHAFTCHDSGATVLSYAPKHQLLISGGRKGFTYAFDLRQKQQRQAFQSHDSPVKAIAVDPAEEYFLTGSAEGNIKIWNLSTFNLLHAFINEHARQSIFRNIGTGVMQIEVGPANHIFSCGADGTVKMRILPDCFGTINEVLKNDVKLML
uniref:DmX-like protein 1 isoform X1 n=1 Tax=Geotrypetes seraphini TaxID=260995 RepID=A0A6P8PLW4_GEOSA|nr:dmX-like protein 1 isoform X1 [Geotrypetes seraphini]